MAWVWVFLINPLGFLPFAALLNTSSFGFGHGASVCKHLTANGALSSEFMPWTAQNDSNAQYSVMVFARLASKCLEAPSQMPSWTFLYIKALKALMKSIRATAWQLNREKLSAGSGYKANFQTELNAGQRWLHARKCSQDRQMYSHPQSILFSAPIFMNCSQNTYWLPLDASSVALTRILGWGCRLFRSYGSGSKPLNTSENQVPHPQKLPVSFSVTRLTSVFHSVRA